MSSTVASTVGWPDVALALIAGLPGLVAAVGTILVRREVHTPNGTTLGQAVEDAQKHASEAHAIVRRTMGERKTDAPKPPTGTTLHKRATDD